MDHDDPPIAGDDIAGSIAELGLLLQHDVIGLHGLGRHGRDRELAVAVFLGEVANGLLKADRTPKIPIAEIRAATTGRSQDTGERLSNCG